ncbi:hypothetical protein [Pseudobdellovibrio exovorus]|uniref:Uncharacterized protein n=1 Tax=Pseudobdellovibrio exovorus JSS TaxID=1184267 RepID=M4VB98_9BACT|nr:hypothetical protein [Pseudobdellovibrio exovorus]AGH96468.1 hypothetical protein A11Q_2252 [Pseudobdellovibrio exovorus JSS]
MAIQRVISAAAMVLTLTVGLTATAEVIEFYTLGAGGKRAENEAFFTDHIQRVVDQVDNLRLADNPINIVVERRSGGASFDYGSIVYIPRTFEHSGQYGGTYSKSIYDILAVFAHEYAHAIFGTFLADASADYAELKRIKSQSSELSLQALRDDPDTETLEQMRQQMKALEDSVVQNPALLKIARQVGPYSELYADAVAVFVTGSKGAIYEALAYEGMPFHMRAYVESRDFGMKHDPDTWTFSDEHAMFGPLRSVIGSDECWPRSDEQKRLRLQQLKTVLIRDLQRKITAGEMPTKDDNKQLIAEYSAYCR